MQSTHTHIQLKAIVSCALLQIILLLHTKLIYDTKFVCKKILHTNLSSKIIHTKLNTKFE
jgi:hypothetical protein